MLRLVAAGNYIEDCIPQPQIPSFRHRRPPLPRAAGVFVSKAWYLLRPRGHHPKEITMFKDIFEAPEAEVARLAAAPEGSKAHFLSTLPVNILGPLDDLMIEMPRDAGWDHTVVVVPFKRIGRSEQERAERQAPFRRHDGWWDCIVVASDHPSYPVGGYRLNISESELVRGTLRTLELATATA